MTRSKHQILITGTLDPEAVETLQACRDLTVIYEPECPREKLLSLIKTAAVVISRSETSIDREVIDHGPQLKVIARAAVGVSNIDISYATQRGILVVNTPGKNTNAAAELTLGLLLGMLRNLPQAHSHLKNSKWDRHQFVGRELRHKKIGLVGLGNVGHRVAKFCRGFDMEVWGYDPYLSPQMFARYDVKASLSLADLVAQVDILSVHTPLNHETEGMITEDSC
jgi:D-3-phosphoglycerate dehydrogenase